MRVGAGQGYGCLGVVTALSCYTCGRGGARSRAVAARVVRVQSVARAAVEGRGAVVGGLVGAAAPTVT